MQVLIAQVFIPFQSHCWKRSKLILVQPVSHDFNIISPGSGRTQGNPYPLSLNITPSLNPKT